MNADSSFLSRMFRRHRMPLDDAGERPSPPRAPDGLRIYAIGDIHGRVDLFDLLMSRIADDMCARPAEKVCFVLLGDLVDRGPASAAVIERVVQYRAAGLTMPLVMGNHEEVLLRTLDGDRDAAELFGQIGGRETFYSYGLSGQDYHRLPITEYGARLGELMPPPHIALLREAEAMLEYGDYVFVHAGVRPGVPLPDQSVTDLRWIRGPFLTSEEDYGRIIVHGHTVTEFPVEASNRIGIDTGAVYTGTLTALALEGEARWFVKAHGEGTTGRDEKSA